MQVKVCPKCKAENRPANAACSSCYTSLDGVDVSESSGPPAARTQSVPAPPRQPGAPAATQRMPAAQQTQMGTMNPPPGMPLQQGQFQMMPPPRRSSGGIVALAIGFVLVVIGILMYVGVSKFGLLKSQPVPTDPPEKSVLQFLEAKKTGNMSKVEPYLCRSSNELINKAFSSRQIQSAGFGKKDAQQIYVFGATPSVDQLENTTVVASRLKDDEFADDRTAVVRVTVDKKSEPAAAPQKLLPPGMTPPPTESDEKKIDLSSIFCVYPINEEFVLVAEDGKWKLDLGQSAQRSIGLGKRGNPFKLGK